MVNTDWKNLYPVQKFMGSINDYGI